MSLEAVIYLWSKLLELLELLMTCLQCSYSLKWCTWSCCQENISGLLIFGWFAASPWKINKHATWTHWLCVWNDGIFMNNSHARGVHVLMSRHSRNYGDASFISKEPCAKINLRHLIIISSAYLVLSSIFNVFPLFHLILWLTRRMLRAKLAHQSWLAQAWIKKIQFTLRLITFQNSLLPPYSVHKEMGRCNDVKGRVWIQGMAGGVWAGTVIHSGLNVALS